MAGSILSHYINQLLLEESPKGNRVYRPDIFFYLFGVAGDEYDDVFDPIMSEKLKRVVNKRSVRYRNKTLRDTENLVRKLNVPEKCKIR